MLEIEQDGKIVVAAFDDALETNDTLCSLELEDDLEGIPLPLSLRTKLLLNRCGARKLLRRHQSSHAQFVRAIASQRDDLNTIYHILSNQPSLICTSMADTTTPPLWEESNGIAQAACLSGEYHELGLKLVLDSRFETQGREYQRSRKKAIRSVKRRIKHMFATSA